MRLWHYQTITLVLATAINAPFSKGPTDLIARVLVAWTLPALLAFALKTKEGFWERYGASLLLLVAFLGAGLVSDL